MNDKDRTAAGSDRRSLLAELRRLVAMAMLPLLGLVAWSAYQRLQHDLDEALAVAGRFARFTATDIERFLRSTESLLDNAVRHPAVARPGGQDCDQAFSAFAAMAPAYGGYVATDLKGRVVCSGDLPGDQRLPGGAQFPLPAGQDASGARIGQAQLDTMGGWVVPIVRPIPASGGRPVGYAGVRLQTAQLQMIVAGARLPAGTVVGLMDGDGRILAHTASAAGQVRGIVPMARTALGARDEGTLSARGHDGGDYLYGFARVGGTDWIAYAVLPAAPVYASAYLNGLYGLLAMLAMLGLGATLATLYGRRMLLPALGAARAARRAAAGELGVRLPEDGPAEMAYVAKQFNRLLGTVAAERRELAAAERRLRDLFQLSADWYWEQDAECRFTLAEGAAFERAPTSRDFIGKRRWELPGYAPLDGNWEAHQAVVARREPFYDTLFAQAVPGSENHYLRVSGIPVFDASGAFAGYHGVAADVTPEMTRRLALQESERRYRDLFDKNHLVNLLVDPAAGRIVDASAEACVFFGHSITLLKQLTLAELDLQPREDRQSCIEFLRTERPDVKELACRARDGSPLVLEAYAGEIELDGRRLLLLTLHDITERRRAEQELRKLARAVAHSPASIMVADADANIEYVNPRFEEVTGYSLEEVRGRNPRLLQSGLTPKAVYEDLWRTLLAGGEWRGELCNRTRDGELFWEYASISAVLDENGKAANFIAVKENITERKRREAELRELNQTLDRRVAERTAELERANCELDAFSYSVSHDLRAPLRAINGFAHLLEEGDGAALSAEGRELLGRVRRNALRMSELIDEMLRFARIGREALSLAKVSLGETAAEAVREMQAQYPHAEAVVGALPEAVCDPVLVKQVFANLIGNAFKYSGKREAPRIEVGCRREGGESVYFVRDNGAGFDMQHAQRLFGVFQRLHHEKDFPGTGVGLAIVKRIVERHGGRIWAESAPGEGATFSFTLAAAE
ncbi:MAG: PAS domain S-box protein [Burkholderiales bacterium]|nr:PAS domain S-box protein [Burkholderiales bacterium]